MVLITVFVRPKSAYAKPNLIQETTVDSSVRLEALIAKLKLPKKGTILYLHGRELPLNSSLATHNVQSGDILECCSSPLISAILSAVLNDLNAVDRLPEDERTEDRIRPLLLSDNHHHQYLDPWHDKWSPEAIKGRIICLAHIKKIIQRNDRYEHWEIPQIDDLQRLFDFLEVASSRHDINGLKNVTRIFSPSTRNRHGKPSTVWELLESKLQKLSRLAALASHPRNTDLIESFVQSECSRHDPSTLATSSSTPLKRTNSVASGRSATTPRPRKRARRTLPATPESAAKTNGNCPCGQRMAESVCLEVNCVFQNKFCCNNCFFADHPVLTRNHERIPLTDPRAKAVQKQQVSDKRKTEYCPAYASGPFAVLSALSKATMGVNGQRRREFSLAEHILKQRAQLHCRSNLYDHQARGRNAFACMERLTADDLVRKEIVPLGLGGGGGGAEDCKYSLMPKGERLAKFCSVFEHMVTTTLQTPAIENGLVKAIGRGNPQERYIVSIIVDSREDGTYAQRLAQRCKDSDVNCDQKELRAGDYLFSFQRNNGPPETVTYVFPLVIERKTWSDLADSVRGRGKGHRRLDCVRIGGDGQCSTGKCQLCRMKRSGCAKVMFIIEGARCLRRTDQQDKCDPSIKLCRYCLELKERHGVGCLHGDLERVLYKLQAHHGCLVHFARDYNETIESLLILRDLVEKSLGDDKSHFGCDDEDYDLARALALSRGEALPKPDATRHKPMLLSDFQSNASRSKTSESNVALAFAKNPAVNRLTAESFVVDIANGNVQVSTKGVASGKTVYIADDTVKRQLSLSQEVVELELSSDEEEDVQESQDSSIQILEESEWRKVSKLKKPEQAISDNDVIVLDDDEEQKESGPSTDIVVLDDDGKNKAARSTGTPLLLITGLYNYDFDFHDDINKLWQKLFREKSEADVTSVENNSLDAKSIETSSFGNNIRQALLGMQQGDVKTPLVPRKAILTWLLNLQLYGDSVVHTAREDCCAEELTSIWQDKRAFGGSGCNSTPSSSNFQKTCEICAKDVGNDKYRTTCGHCFHHKCLLQWYRHHQTCPVCRCSIDHPPKPPASKASLSKPSPHPASSATRPPLVASSNPQRSTPASSSRSTSTEAGVREARLRRFTQASVGVDARARNPAARASTEWSCDKCTLLNPADYVYCKACGEACPLKAPAARLAPAADILYTTPPRGDRSRHASTPQEWNCVRCTFLNVPGATQCEACTAPCHLVPADVGLAVTASAAGLSENNSHSRGNPIRQAERASSGTKKSIKCGACGLEGHNRATATAESCPHYNHPVERELRQKKKEQAEQKAREKEEEVKRINSSKEEDRRKAEQIQRNMAELQASLNSRAVQDDQAARRLEKEVERLRKRARKFD